MSGASARTSDIDALLDSEIRVTGDGCKIRPLTGAARLVYDRGMERDLNAGTISRTLKKMNVDVGPESIRRHRRGECVRCLKNS